jgi:hypothetical protein
VSPVYFRLALRRRNRRISHAKVRTWLRGRRTVHWFHHNESRAESQVPRETGSASRRVFTVQEGSKRLPSHGPHQRSLPPGTVHLCCSANWSLFTAHLLRSVALGQVNCYVLWVLNYLSTQEMIRCENCHS